MTGVSEGNAEGEQGGERGYVSSLAVSRCGDEVKEEGGGSE